METFLFIFIASIVGSPHCAIMCGGFAASCSNTATHQISYHIGRGLSYTLLGALAGYIGQNINNLLFFTGLSNITALAIGLVLIYWGIRQIIKPDYLVDSAQAPGFITKAISKVYKLSLSEKKGAFLLGFCSSLLPCGWLYTYVGVAASSGGVSSGAIMMFVFWIGTVPILTSIGTTGLLLKKYISQFAPRLTGVLFILAGIFSLLLHQGIVNIDLMDHHHHHHHNSNSQNSKVIDAHSH